MKLRTKIFLSFSILNISLLSFITYFAYSRYAITIEEKIDSICDSLFENAVTASNNTLSQLQETFSIFYFYYSDGTTFLNNIEDFSDPDNPPDIYDAMVTNQQFKKSCQNTIYMNEFIYGIYVITPCGYVLSNSTSINGTLVEGIDYSSQLWYKDLMKLNGATYTSIVSDHALFSGEKKSIYFAKEIRDIYTHSPLGILIVDCDPEFFSLSTTNTMPETALLTIENPSTNDVLYTSYKDSESSFSPQNRKVKTAKLNLSPLQLVAVFDYDSLYQEYSVTVYMMLALAGLCIIISLILSYIFASSIVKPLEHLSQKMATQSGHSLKLSGQYLNRNDEIGTLYNEYNTMAESLNAAVKQDYQNKLITLDAQMKSLEARINSHFLFNTLESINSIAELEDNELIATMSLSLGNMFRYTLKTQSELVSVADELSHVYDYVTIQQIRFDNRFHLEINMDEAFKKEQVLKLILQPLVENALYHGLKYCSCGDKIAITGKLHDTYLILHVRDNGCGIDAKALAKLQQSLQEEASFTELGQRNKQSIGLKNIHSRIVLYYGEGYGLTITSSENQYTDVQIKIPKLRRKNDHV